MNAFDDVGNCEFKEGQSVFAMYGAFENFQGKIISVNYNKLVALVEFLLFHKKTLVEIPIKYLKV